jgi:hypothetical protein
LPEPAVALPEPAVALAEPPFDEAEPAVALVEPPFEDAPPWLLFSLGLELEQAARATRRRR